MPVMKQLRIGSETYDTVGEASVTQVQTSGTKIATVTIDGTATDLYAPEGGSSIDPASAAPLMDGTAAAGTSTDYARADHVHPTDTSRAAASHTHAIADVTNLQSALDGKQGTLVSGTNIKTVNGESILGSGNIATPTYTLPEATTSTLGGVKVDGTTITATDGVISAVGGGGGGGGYDLVINVTLNDGGTAVVSHDADFLECMSFARAFASGQDVRAVAYCRYASYDDEDDIYAAGADALPLVYADTQSYGGGQYETDGGWSLTFIAVASITQRTVSGNKVSYVNARQLVVHASNDDPELGVSVDYSVL